VPENLSRAGGRLHPRAAS